MLRDNKSKEHDDSLCVLFGDLRKAYDSVPREAMWGVLEKYGVPTNMLSVVRSFYEDMTAVVRVRDSTTSDIEITNGLRQGCTLAPTLFNLYFSAMVSPGRSDSEVQNWKEASEGQDSKGKAPGGKGDQVKVCR